MKLQKKLLLILKEGDLLTFYKVARSIVNGIARILFRIEIEGRDNIPKEGSLIICANHISLLDPVMIAISVQRPISFMAKKELFENKILGKLFLKFNAIPVSRGESDLSAIRSSLKVLKDNNVLGIFPQGTRVDKVDLESTKSGIGLLAIKGKSPVIPIFIDTQYKLFGKVKIIIGEPMSFESYYNRRLGSKDYKLISQEIMGSIYSLKND